MSLVQKIQRKIFGHGGPTTQEAAAELDRAVKSETGFLDRAIQVFNRRYDLLKAYYIESEAVTAVRKSYDDTHGFFASLALLGIVAGGALLLIGGVAAPWVAVVAGSTVVLGSATVRSGQVQTVLEAEEAKIKRSYDRSEDRARIAIEAMERDLERQPAEVRQQFHEAFSRAAQRTQILNNEVAAMRNVAALQDVSSAAATQSAVTAGVIAGSIAAR